VPILARDRALLVGIGLDQARIDGKAFQPRQTSADRHELQFAVNYLAGWVLVNRLRPNLAAAAPSRIVNVASSSASAIDFDDVMLERPGALPLPPYSKKGAARCRNAIVPHRRNLFKSVSLNTQRGFVRKQKRFLVVPSARRF
jgi:hypothetical protein